MKKLIMLLGILFLFLSTSHKAFACSPTFPSLWPPSISSTISTEHSVGITWSMNIPFIGDIQAYRIYLNGNLVHTIDPSVTSLMFSPAGHGSYAVRNLEPNTAYTMAVGVVFAIPVGCGITWNVEMKSSASITTKPKGWNHGAGNSSYSSVQNSSKPHAPVLYIRTSPAAHNAIFAYNVTGAYSNANFEQEQYPITNLFITVGSVCNSASFSGYQNSPYYTESYGKGYNITVPQVCGEVVPYKTEYIKEGRNYESKEICRYKLNRPYGIINKEINISNGNLSGNVNLSGLTGDTEYVLYGYAENSNGDISAESAPVFFTTPQGKTVMPAACSNGNRETDR